MSLFIDCLCCEDAPDKFNETLIPPTRDDAVKTWRVPANLGLKGSKVQAVHLFLNDSYMAVGTLGGNLFIWNVADPDSEPAVSQAIDEEGLWSIASNGNTLYLGCNRGVVQVHEFGFDLSLTKKKDIKTDSFQAIFTMVFFRDHLFASLGEGIGRIDPKTGKTTKRLSGHGNYVRQIVGVEDSDGGYLWSCGQDGQVIQWSNDEKKQTNKVFDDIGHKSTVNCMAVLGDHLYTGGGDWKVCKTQISTSSGFSEEQKHQAPVSCLFTYQQKIITCSIDCQIREWSNNLECTRTLEGHEKSIQCAFITSNGQLFTGAGDGSIKQWDLNSDGVMKPPEFKAAEDGAVPVSFSAQDGVELAVMDEGMQQERNPLGD